MKAKPGHNPNSLANLTNRHIATDPANFAKIGAETRKRRGMIRRATLAALESGTISINSKDAEILDGLGNKMDIDFASVVLRVPNYIAIGMKLMQEAMKGDMTATKILIELDENYKNREIKAKEKTADAQHDMASFLNGIKVEKPLEIPVTPYEELGRSAE